MRKYFITGLVILIPLVITLVVLRWVVETMDQSLQWLPLSWRPEHWLGFNIPGSGVVLMLLLVFATGLLFQNVIGAYVFSAWERLIQRIPIVRPIYSSVKQVSDTLFSPNGTAFRKAVLIQYPRAGVWTIAFITGTPSQSVAKHLNDEHISVYVPTTPNPTSGFFLILARTELIELDLTIDEALKYVVSMGVITPK